MLDGFNNEPLVIVRDQMQQAISDRQYELAGRAHETSKSLEYVERKLSMLASATLVGAELAPRPIQQCQVIVLLHR